MRTVEKDLGMGDWGAPLYILTVGPLGATLTFHDAVIMGGKWT